MTVARDPASHTRPSASSPEIVENLPDFQSTARLTACNLVMKGGVTSGVVFPGTIRVLASTYRFRRIGGTSAGAIAAAFAAAGEYARRESGQSTVFDEIYKLGDELSRTPPGGRYRTYLEALFAPNASTEPTSRLITALTRDENERKASPLPVTEDERRRERSRRRVTAVGRTVRAFAAAQPLPAAASAAGLLGVLAGGVGLLGGQSGAAGLALAGTWGTLAGLAWLGQATVVDGLRRVTANGYGLSKGFEILDADDSAPRGDGTQTLRFTSWLHTKLQRLTGLDRAPGSPGAGVTPVLTFGHLSPAAYRLPANWSDLYTADSAPDDPVADEVAELSFEAHAANRQRMDRDIDLRQITTNLTFGRPVTLPVDETSTDARHLYFRPDQWQQFFPAEIMAHLVRHAERVIQPDGEPHVYYRLPPAAMLPVVVSTRLSMSFPGLFTPVPLHYGTWFDEEKLRPDSVAASWPKGGSRKRRHSYRSLHLADWQAETPGRHRLEPLVFGDGGLTSNFPLALFDDLSPTEPTFGLDLYYPKDGDQRRAFLIPPSLLRERGKGDAEQRARWYPSRNATGSLLGYALSILESARNWSDNAMMGLPGFGERVVHIVISEGLGGTNLSMSSEQILTLRSRGVEAGQRLIQRFLTGQNVRINRAFSVPWSWEIHSANQFLRLTADLERALQEYALAYSVETPPGTVELNVPAIPAGMVRVQNDRLFDDPQESGWRKRALDLITLGRQPTTLHGYRKLRGRRGLLRYRTLQ